MWFISLHSVQWYVSFWFLYLGTKIDLRDSPEEVGKLQEKGKSPFKREYGNQKAKRLGAVAYMECSALTQKGLKEVRPGLDFTSVYSRRIAKTRRAQRMHGSCDSF